MADRLPFLLLWLSAGLIGAGWLYAWSCAGIDDVGVRRENLGMSLFMCLLGPITLVVGFLASGFGYYGWWHWRHR